MLRSFGTAVHGLAMAMLITAVVPWVFLPEVADWSAMGIGIVAAVAALLAVTGWFAARASRRRPASFASRGRR